MRVLVIGGSGAVGSLVLPALAQRHELRLLDLQPPPESYGEFVQGSVTDPDSLPSAMAGQDALVYLAMGRQQGWGETLAWAASQFDVNVTGLHLALWAAAEAGIRQVVHSSSASVFADYRAQDHSQDPRPDAHGSYGLSKRLGEEVCAAASRRHGMSITALRLVGPLTDEAWHGDESAHRDVVTAGSDVAAAYLAALERPEPGFRALVVTGAHKDVIDWSSTESALGWRPRHQRDLRGQQP